MKKKLKRTSLVLPSRYPAILGGDFYNIYFHKFGPYTKNI